MNFHFPKSSELCLRQSQIISLPELPKPKCLIIIILKSLSFKRLWRREPDWSCKVIWKSLAIDSSAGTWCLHTTFSCKKKNSMLSMSLFLCVLMQTYKVLWQQHCQLFPSPLCETPPWLFWKLVVKQCNHFHSAILGDEEKNNPSFSLQHHIPAWLSSKS